MSSCLCVTIFICCCLLCTRHLYFENISTFDYCRGSVQGCKELLKWNVVLRHKKKERRLSSGGRWIDLKFFVWILCCINSSSNKLTRAVEMTLSQIYARIDSFLRRILTIVYWEPRPWLRFHLPETEFALERIPTWRDCLCSSKAFVRGRLLYCCSLTAGVVGCETAKRHCLCEATDAGGGKQGTTKSNLFPSPKQTTNLPS